MKTARLVYPGILMASLLALDAPAAHARPAPGAAKEPIAAFGKKRDNHTPIEVTADALEVLQDENKASFTGHVVAIQGDLRLTADVMHVHYARRDGDRKAGKGKDRAGENAIRKIEAEGKVFLATPQETASGASAVYDVDEQEIRIHGHVVLTRGKNVLEGDHLVYNFATGKSRIAGREETGAAGGDRKRVRALFVPEKEKQKGSP